MADSDDGKADRIYLPNDRVFERTQGCWNCVHKRSATEFWTKERQRMLTKALTISMHSKLGENHPKVFNIRTAVNQTDHNVAAGLLIQCGSNLVRPGRTADGNPVGDLVSANFLCDRWSGAQGASIARAGQKADALPEELADKVGNAVPDRAEIEDRLKHEDSDN